MQIDHYRILNLGKTYSITVIALPENFYEFCRKHLNEVFFYDCRHSFRESWLPERRSELCRHPRSSLRAVFGVTTSASVQLSGRLLRRLLWWGKSMIEICLFAAKLKWNEWFYLVSCFRKFIFRNLQREEHPLSDSQYDTTEAAMSTVDPNLDWSKALGKILAIKIITNI